MYALVKQVENPVTKEIQDVITLFTGVSQFQDKDGIGYAPSYLRQWTATEKKDHGIYEVVYGTYPDGRFYNIAENAPTFENDIVSVTFTSTSKDLEDGETDEATGRFAAGLKTQYINQYKQAANSMLASTDWMIVRKLERDIDVPSEMAAKRAAVVAEADRLETVITAVTTVEELIAAVNSAEFPTS
jgi:hypothetical protein